MFKIGSFADVEVVEVEVFMADLDKDDNAEAAVGWGTSVVVVGCRTGVSSRSRCRGDIR